MPRRSDAGWLPPPDLSGRAAKSRAGDDQRPRTDLGCGDHRCRIEYLDQVDGTEPPIPRQANVSVTQQLVDDVIAAGGVLRVPRKSWHDRDSIDYVLRAQLAERHGKVPADKLLVTSTLRDEVEIRLIDVKIEGARAGIELLPVAVPERVARYHAAARSFRDHTDLHEVSRDQLQRATRVLHAIAIEAQRRGWPVGTDAGAMKITAQDLVCHLTIAEKGARRRGPWEQQVHHYRNVRPDDYFWRDRELPRGAYDKDATGELTLALSCEGNWFAGRQGRWSDRRSWTLEERLPHLFREIEARIIHARRMREQERIRAEDAAERARRDAEERERAWRELITTARGRLVEDHRIVRLTADLDAWDEARRIRAYCNAAEAAHPDSADAAEWIAWARSRAQHLDPLAHAPTFPEPPEATPQALQPYLPDGWSAQGPPAPRPNWMFRSDRF